ncbi:hypothetical protein SAMN05216282_102272 [Cryobacterium psychrotolerans]|uniref:Uncharacterized protein n=1 Tax=Cryobacterium psychrotolerans TaxID=386301 RepID=A0A1G8YUJ8_9MICO|nr:hypothetical protein [Cryobacterium psychrotolerans]SDK05660.1 hypothetical protein SAMN05216282_102272 [Cryobacterium psychrotolerans]
MSGFRSRSVALAATLLIATAALTGCSDASPDLTPGAASQLQDGVLAVSTAAAAGDFAEAQTALAVVQADVLAATKAGDVTADRSAEIQAAIKLVGTDLAAAIAVSTPEPTKAPEPTDEPAPSPEPTTTPTPTPTPAPEPTVEPAPDPTVEPVPEPAPAPEPPTAPGEAPPASTVPVP